MRGVTKERDKEVQGKINRRRRWLSLIWAILGLGVVIIIVLSPKASGTAKGGDIRDAIAIVYNEASAKKYVVGTLAQKNKDVGYVLTVAGSCIANNAEGGSVKVWLPKMGSEWLNGTVLKIQEVTGGTMDNRLSPYIALIEVQLGGVKNKPVPVYNGSLESIRGGNAEIWRIDFDTGRTELYTSGKVTTVTLQKLHLTLDAELKAHIDGAPVVLKSKKDKYTLLGILPELAPGVTDSSGLKEFFGFDDFKYLMSGITK